MLLLKPVDHLRTEADPGLAILQHDATTNQPALAESVERLAADVPALAELLGRMQPLREWIRLGESGEGSESFSQGGKIGNRRASIEKGDRIGRLAFAGHPEDDEVGGHHSFGWDFRRRSFDALHGLENAITLQ
jgi:hypothetical protein